MSQDMREEIDKIMNAEVKDIMRTKFITVDSNENIRDIARKMSDGKTSFCLVMDKEKVVGIITERDIVRRLVAVEKSPGETGAKEIMSSPIIAVDKKALLADAALVMAKNKIRKLAVIDEKSKLIGMVTASDLARALAYQMKLENILFNAMARETPPPSKMYE